MSRIEENQKLYASLLGDPRIKVVHISIYTALLYLWQQNGCNNPVPITRSRVMALAHVQSIATYHKYIKELEAFGYIGYVPNYNPYLSSQITICMPLP